MIPIKNEQLRVLLVLHVIERLEFGALEELLHAGIEPHTLDTLRKLPGTDLLRIAQMKRPVIGFAIDPAGLEIAMDSLQRIADEEKLLEYFAGNGASIPMLRQLFKTDPKIIQSYRALLGAKRNGGRPMMPPEATRDAIHQFWNGLTESDIRRRYLRLHEAFQTYPLETLYAVVNEFED